MPGMEATSPATILMTLLGSQMQGPQGEAPEPQELGAPKEVLDAVPGGPLLRGLGIKNALKMTPSDVAKIKNFAKGGEGWPSELTNYRNGLMSKVQLEMLEAGQKDKVPFKEIRDSMIEFAGMWRK